MSEALIIEDAEAPELLPPIAALIATLEKIVRENPRAIELAGGNLLLHIRDVGTWTIVTRGPRKGIHAEATDDEVAFALVCEEWVMLDLLERPERIDVAKLTELGFLYIQGELRVYERLMELAEQKNLLAVRAGSAGTASPTKPAAKKMRRVA